MFQLQFMKWKAMQSNDWKYMATKGHERNKKKHEWKWKDMKGNELNLKGLARTINKNTPPFPKMKSFIWYPFATHFFRLFVYPLAQLTRDWSKYFFNWWFSKNAEIGFGLGISSTLNDMKGKKEMTRTWKQHENDMKGTRKIWNGREGKWIDMKGKAMTTSKTNPAND